MYDRSLPRSLRFPQYVRICGKSPLLLEAGPFARLMHEWSRSQVMSFNRSSLHPVPSIPFSCLQYTHMQTEKMVNR